MPSHPVWDDLDDFLDVDDFACVAIVTLADGTVLPRVVGVFDEPGTLAALGTFEQDTTRPTFTCKWSAVSVVRRGDVFVILDDSGVPRSYDAHQAPTRTGDGMATVRLEPSL